MISTEILNQPKNEYLFASDRVIDLLIDEIKEIRSCIKQLNALEPGLYLFNQHRILRLFLTILGANRQILRKRLPLHSQPHETKIIIRICDKCTTQYLGTTHVCMQ